MTYGCEIWGYKLYDNLDNLWKKFLKLVLNVKMTTCTNMVFAELGVFPLYTVIQTRMVVFWSRLISGKSKKLNYILYKHILKLHEVGKEVSPWLAKIKEILNNCGMSNIFISHNITSVQWTKNCGKQKSSGSVGSTLAE